RGDFNPACALAEKLTEKGYQICIATHKNFETFVKSRELEFAPISGNYQEILETEAGLNLLEGSGRLKLIDDELLYQQMMDAYDAATGSDALIIFPLSYFGYYIAEKLNIPCIFSCFMPITATKKFPFLRFDLDKTPKISAPLNYFSYVLIDFLSWQSNRKIINRFRKEVGLSPINILGNSYRRNIPKMLKPQNILVLYLYSSAIVPRPQDWRQENIHITGNCFLEENEDYQPTLELKKFLDGGSQPLYIGFGSMTLREPNKYLDLLITAVRKTNQRAIISSSWSKMHLFYDEVEKSPNIFVIDSYVPHNWLFKEVKLVIHHGGAGTTAQALRAGTPQIVIPFFGDQPAWGNRMVKIGVASDCIPYQKLTTESLTKAIANAVNNEELEKQAQVFSDLIKKEDGVTNAANMIENYLSAFAGKP
ncbi:MAG: glycosyltransferase, partial [Cyanobacteria bacterium J06621_8]